MSYTLTPYLVDLEALRRAVGSGDEALLAAIVAENPERLGSDEVEEEGEIPLGQALRHLVMGKLLQKEPAYQYGYALEQLCDHLGEIPACDMWEGIGWQTLEATGVEQVLKRSGPPVPLPPSTDFPRIGHLTAGEIAATVAQLGNRHLTTAAPSGRKPRRSLASILLSALQSRITQRPPLTDDDVQELMEEYERWLRHAAASGKSLVLFYY